MVTLRAHCGALNNGSIENEAFSRYENSLEKILWILNTEVLFIFLTHMLTIFLLLTSRKVLKSTKQSKYYFSYYTYEKRLQLCKVSECTTHPVFNMVVCVSIFALEQSPQVILAK